MARLSRRKLADYVVASIDSGASLQAPLKNLAGYLVATRRTREDELIVRDIEEQLALRGVVIGDVVSARPLSDALRAEITRLTGGDSLELRESVDPSVLGGIRLNLPGKRYDSTLRRRLINLQNKQV